MLDYTSPFFPLRLAWHAIVAVLAAIGILIVPVDSIQLALPLGPVPVEASWEVDLSLPARISSVVLIVILMLLYHYTRDWAKYVPAHWDLRIHFDPDGVSGIVNSFPEKEREAMKINPDWAKHQSTYLSYLNKLMVSRGAREQARFGPTTTGTGDFEFRYRKTAGRQQYCIQEGRGVIQFEFYAADDHYGFPVIFTLKRGADRCIEPTVRQLFKHFQITVKLTFLQSVAVVPDGYRTMAEFVCVTKIVFLPHLHIGDTLYLIDFRQLRGQASNVPARMSHPMVPVAYADNSFG